MRSSDLFRTHVNARRITSFQQLIAAMATAERHGNELVKREIDRLQDSYQEHLFVEALTPKLTCFCFIFQDVKHKQTRFCSIGLCRQKVLNLGH
ncbi:hypothetical protein RchiOBHm_Chr7g0240151 [Rosa chinensis]|uniref:Uncharacterized protein n=1 Tax=Rosa chinensis TaxID=74649 RepID=A0A2P6PHX0_ROSCH|nr:hypothetical protein RchiOBHm_Chr7g0240151 [Rosa chinensis]